MPLGTKIWRYFMSYQADRRICTANGGLPPAVKRRLYYVWWYINCGMNKWRSETTGKAVIVLIRIVNIISGFVIQKRFIILHTTTNKLTGALLFILPFTLQIVDLSYSAAIVCCFATFAAVQEGHYIRTGKINKKWRSRVSRKQSGKHGLNYFCSLLIICDKKRIIISNHDLLNHD